jgi:hypothetical protein
MAEILARLHGAPERLLSSSRLKAAILDYQPGDGRSRESAERSYRRDRRALVARGLVQTDVTTRRTPNREGVQALFVGKPTDWELTAIEHAAIRRARRLHPSAPPPTTTGRSAWGARLDVAMDALRVLEEHGDWMSGAELAKEMQRPVELVIAAVRELNLVETGATSVFLHTLDVCLYDDEIDEEWAPGEVLVCAARNDASHRPRGGYGLDILGRFAYTADETRDRLGLIALALDEPGADTNVAALESAQRKLEQWHAHLEQARAA